MVRVTKDGITYTAAQGRPSLQADVRKECQRPLPEPSAARTNNSASARSKVVWPRRARHTNAQRPQKTAKNGSNGKAAAPPPAAPLRTDISCRNIESLERRRAFGYRQGPAHRDSDSTSFRP